MAPETIENGKGHEAPKDVEAKLQEFGLKWKGNAIEVNGTNQEVFLDQNTKNVTFNVKTGDKNEVEITIHNNDNSTNILLISKGSIKVDGVEQRFIYEGKPLTLGEVQYATEAKMVEHVQQNATDFFEKEAAKTSIDLMLIKYGDKGWVKKVSNTEIAVVRPNPSDEPLFTYEKGKFVPIVNYRGSMDSFTKTEFEAYIQKGPHHND